MNETHAKALSRADRDLFWPWPVSYKGERKGEMVLAHSRIDAGGLHRDAVW